MRSKVVPVRVDFAGGWLDVPRFADPGGCIVNCAVLPPVEAFTGVRGMGGSGAALVKKYMDAGHDRAEAGRLAAIDEVRSGTGWQDSAIATETGLCVWRSGSFPQLHMKCHPGWLDGHLWMYDTKQDHNTIDIASKPREYYHIRVASSWAARAVLLESPMGMAGAVDLSRQAQLEEGMFDWTEKLCELIPHDDFSWKYLGSGWGGALLVFLHKVGRPVPAELMKLTPFILPYP